MPKGIFCMAKNLTEVIVNIEPSHRKEFYHVTSYRGKIASAANTFIYDFVVTFFFTATLRSRSKKEKKWIFLFLIREALKDTTFVTNVTKQGFFSPPENAIFDQKRQMVYFVTKVEGGQSQCDICHKKCFCLLKASLNTLNNCAFNWRRKYYIQHKDVSSLAGCDPATNRNRDSMWY